MAKRTRLRKSEIEKIYEFVQLLKQQGINVSKVILFGSYAKGRANGSRPSEGLDGHLCSTAGPGRTRKTQEENTKNE